MADFGIGEALTLAATAAGTGLSVAGAQQAQSNMNKAAQQQVNSQEALQKQATPIYQQNAKASSPQQAQQTLGNTMASTLAAYKNLQSLSPSTQPLSVSPPSAQVSAATQADIARQQQANAALQGYPQLLTNWNTGNTLTNAQLGNIGSIGQTLSNAFGTNLAAAQTSGNTLSGYGSLAQSVGNVAGAYGAQQGNQSMYQNILSQLAQRNAIANNPNFNTTYQPVSGSGYGDFNNVTTGGYS